MESKFTNLRDALEKAAHSDKGITFIHGTNREVRLSYAHLLNQAYLFVRKLRATGLQPDQEVIIYIENPEFFLPVFWACVLGKFRAVPVSVGFQEEHIGKLTRINEHLTKSVLVTEGLLEDKLRNALLANSPSIPTEDLVKSMICYEVALNEVDEPNNDDLPIINAADICYIQFSSGSTGKPKGVTLTHQNLLANTLDIIAASKILSSDKLLSWMPLTHDMGMICFHLTAVVAAADQFIIPTAVFIRKPTIWLEKASIHLATLLYSPNFGLNYLLSAIRNSTLHCDLSRVRLIYNGAEPISLDVCNEFVNTLKVNNLRNDVIFPGYGLAEASVAVTLSTPNSDLISVKLNRSALKLGKLVQETTDGVTYLAVGFAMAHCQVRICDNDDRQVSDDTLGHIQVRGLNVMTGYYRDSIETKKVFTDDGWLRTGDIGFVRTGLLFVTGRQKNIIIINGQNLFPHDIENVCQSVPGIQAGHVVACGIDDGMQSDNKLVLFVLYRGKAKEFPIVQKTVVDKVLKTMGLTVDDVVAVKRIPKTTSGKVQYYKLRDAYVNGVFDLAIRTIPAPTQENLPEAILTLSKRVLGEQLDFAKDLFSQGYSSLQLVQLSLAIQNHYNIPFQLSDLLELKSLRQFSSMLADRSSRPVDTKYLSGSRTIKLNSIQKRFWLFDQRYPEQNVFTLSGACILSGSVDIDKFLAAVHTFVDIHPILNCCVTLSEVGPVLTSRSKSPVPVYYNPTILTDEHDVNKFLKEKAAQPFDINTGPLCRFQIFRLNTGKYLFIYDFHHIVFDGWSFSIFLNQLASIYAGRTDSHGLTLPEQAAYITTNDHLLKSPHGTASKNFWSAEMQNLPNPVIDTLRSGAGSDDDFRCQTVTADISNVLLTELKQTSRLLDATVFMTLTALIKGLIFNHSRQRELIIGTTAANRTSASATSIGCHIQSMFIRTTVSNDTTFRSLIAQVKHKTLQGLGHHAYSIDDLIVETLESREQALDLLDVLILYRNYNEVLSLSLEGRRVDADMITIAPTNSGAKLQFEFIEKADGLQFNLSYRSSLFTSIFIEDLMAEFCRLLKQVHLHIDSPILNLVSELSPDQKILKWSQGKQCLHQSSFITTFEARAEQFPDKIAVILGERAISYRDLDNQANALAHRLRIDYGVKEQDNVGILMDRSLSMFVALLAIVKTGAVFVPMDGEYPVKRLERILEQVPLKILLTNKPTVVHQTPLLNVDTVDLTLAINLRTRIKRSPSDVAYVMFTSGTTGKPKGVIVEWKSVDNYINSFREYFDIRNSDVVIQQASIAFDTFIEETLPTLAVGGTLVCIQEGGRDIRGLEENIRLRKATILSTTPTVLAQLNLVLPLRTSLRAIISGGERLSFGHVSNLLENHQVYNTYGPVETTVCASFHKVISPSNTGIIGRPIDNVSMWVLNDQGNICDVGEKGEIFIGGAGVSRGYIDQPGETSRKFVAAAFDENIRLYATGDFGRWLPNGTLEYLGRIDEQAKVRGYRVELAEVEQVLLSHPAVLQCAVVSRQDNTGTAHLVAYYVSKIAIDRDELRRHMSTHLSDYMVPTRWVEMPSFPMSVNGKIDKYKLPHVELLVDDRMFVKPRTQQEEVVANIWKELLNIQQVGIHSNFFELGGDSIIAIRLLTRLREQGYNILAKDIFKYQSIATLVASLSETDKKEVDLQHRLTRLSVFPDEFSAHERLSSEVGVEEMKSFMDSPLTDGGIRRYKVHEVYPLSPMQEGMLFHSLYDKHSTAYIEQFVFDLFLSLDLQIFKSAWKIIFAKHTILRTSFTAELSIPVQCVYGAVEIPLHVLDLRHREENERAQVISEILKSELQKGFDLQDPPLMRMTLLRMGEGHSRLIWTIHHIIVDGWSTPIIMREFLETYCNLQGGVTMDIDRVDRYSDFIAALARQDKKKAKEFWLEYIRHAEPSFLPPMRDADHYQYKEVSFQLDDTLSALLRNFAGKNHLTLNTLIQSAWSFLLFNAIGSEDVLFGVTVSGRNIDIPAIEERVGLFINTIPFRARFEQRSLVQWMSTLQDQHVECREYSNYPLADLQRDSGAVNGLFDTLLVFENYPFELDNGQHQTIQLVSRREETNYKLTIIVDLSRTLSFRICYNSSQVDYNFVTQIEQKLVHLLRLIVDKRTERVSDLHLLDQQDKLLLNTFNATDAPFPKGKPLHVNFQEQVFRTPNKVAVKYERQTLTYNELNAAANEVANCILSTVDARQGFIALHLGRSVEAIVAMLGVLKAGFAYVPIAATIPVERKRSILQISGAVLIVTTKELSQSTNELAVALKMVVIDVDAVHKAALEANNGGVSRVVTGNDPAYIMFTSGSTGIPKGVMATHDGISRLIFCKQFDFLSQGTIGFQYAPLEFDAATFEIWGCLLHGGLLIIPPKHVDSLDELSVLVKDYEVNVLWLTAGLFHQLVELNIELFDGLTHLLAGGDSINPTAIEKVMSRNGALTFINGYGPTESTTFATLHIVPPSQKIEPKNIIGKPISNTRIYIVRDLGGLLSPVPPGFYGEIYISGEGLALGYIGDHDQTQARFIRNPFEPNGLMYKTGDYGRWSLDGTIEYMGRTDDQIKIRGYRIEVGEISSLLQSLPSVSQSFVHVHMDESGDKQLIAYVIPAETFDRATVITYMKNHLPDYMIPIFILVDHLPLTTNGKIDKSKLPSPRTHARNSERLPVTEEQARMALLWSKILSIDNIGIESNFFEIGGHSLSATRLVSAVKRDFDVTISLKHLFEFNTISTLSQYVEVLRRQRLSQNSSYEVLDI